MKNEDEELELMALPVVLATRERNRKHKEWVKEIYKNRNKDGIKSLVSQMQVK